MKYLKLSLILTFFAIFIISCGDAPKTNNSAENTAKNTLANTNVTVNAATPASDESALGKKIYEQNCANCHKPDGTGGKVTIEGKTINADNLTTAKMKEMADEKYVKYIENGIPDEGMPAFKGRISDAEIKAVIVYIRKEFQK